jgi:CDP-diacylglycerol--glycerol-3-phosphate 3-phosphatidyltransferase
VLLLGILIFYLFSDSRSTLGILLVCLALIGSLLTSYIRARAEAIGIECKIGLFTRPERVIVLTVGLLASPINNVLIIALAIIATLSFVTAGQRLFYVLKKTRDQRGGG